jgi:mono/diheme cytochrome c family protein
MLRRWGSVDHNGGAYARARTMVNASSLPILFISCTLGGNSEAELEKTTSPSRNPIEGPKIFRYYCAAGHGADGRGLGPASAALKHAVPDLTLISQRNGGKFPHEYVRKIIDGKQPGPLAHGDREMPIWGPVFHEVESDQDWGEVRLDAITKYLQSIQQK